jgi:site-specific DNA recombinase
MKSLIFPSIQAPVRAIASTVRGITPLTTIWQQSGSSRNCQARTPQQFATKRSYRHCAPWSLFVLLGCLALPGITLASQSMRRDAATHVVAPCVEVIAHSVLSVDDVAGTKWWLARIEKPIYLVLLTLVGGSMCMVTVPLVPGRPGEPLRVLIIGRISTPHQTEESVEASYEYVKKFLGENYKGEVCITCLGEQKSGMVADRQTIREAEDMIAGGMVDVLIVEDVGRIYRDPRHLIAFVNDTVDAGVRLIAINDTLDTANEDWEVLLTLATVRHGFASTDAKKRVRRTATYAFHRGGDVRKVIFGFRKLSKEEAASGQFGPVGLRLAKIADCTPTIMQMKDMVMAGARYVAIAEWLNSQGSKPGPYSKSGRWTAKLVIDFLRSRLLRGERELRKVIHQRIRKSGKHLRLRNPNPERKHYPELAHFTPEEHDELLARMDALAEQHRTKSGEVHPLWRLPRSKGIWPSALDGICSACNECTYVCDDDRLKCSNSFRRSGDHRCWNHVVVNRDRIRTTVIPWLWSMFDDVPEARKAFLEAAWDEIERLRDRQCSELTVETQQVERLEKEAERLGAAIAQGGSLATLLTMLQDAEAALAVSRARCDEIRRQSDQKLPFDRESFLTDPLATILELARISFEFGDLMRRIVKELVIVPVQDLLHGQVRPRVRITVEFSRESQAGGSSDPIVRTLTFDAFDWPQYIRLVEPLRKLRMAMPNATRAEIADSLGVNIDVLKRTTAYIKLMAEHGVTEPFIELTSRPVRASRWRHRDDAA